MTCARFSEPMRRCRRALTRYLLDTIRMAAWPSLPTAAGAKLGPWLAFPEPNCLTNTSGCIRHSKRHSAMVRAMMQALDREAERRARAEMRRRSYPGQVVASGTPKPALYDALGPLQRLAHLTALCRRQAELSGTAERSLPRSQWPGQVFRIGEA